MLSSSNVKRSPSDLGVEVSVDTRLKRRSLALGLAGIAVGTALAPSAFGRGRVALGGRVAFRVPWPLDRLDPHDGSSVAAALFSEACFDTLYTRDDSGAFVASLAEHEPEVVGAEVRVTLREGLKTARGRPISARECAASIARARGAGLSGWLADVPAPRVEGSVLRFATKDPARLVRALASPLLAIVPFGFSPEAPDGTGPFRAMFRADGLVLSRNPNASRGASFLDEIVVGKAQDLKASLRAFESGADDMGWLGMGLYEPRPAARPFDAGPVAYVGLFVGRDAGTWDSPGLAQRVCDSLAPTRLAEFSLGPPWPVDPGDGWQGPAGPLLVREDAPYMVELAKAIVGLLSRPGHELTVKPVSADELAQKRSSRLFCLALDVIRPVGPGSFGSLVGLTQASEPGRAREVVLHPPRMGDVPVRTLTRTLRVGVVGEVRAQGGRVPDVVLPASSGSPGIDFGAARRLKKA